MPDEAALPTVTEADLQRSGLPSLMKMSPGLALFFNDAVYARCKAIAGHMSKADGMMPKHLLGKPEACFAVISRAITWNLDPYSVAMATYQTPSGSIGYMGTLIQAILESSGALNGGVTFAHHGDWEKVQGKFKIETGKSGGKYPTPLWTQDDAKGLYVVVSAKLKNELEPRTLKFELNEAFPLNSPLWATAPNRQICYTAVRAFGNISTPALLMGVPFDVDPTGFYDGAPMQDITPTPPRPARDSAFNRPETTEKPAGDTPHDDDKRQPAGDGEQAKSEDVAEEVQQQDEETPLARGQRLLASMATTNDVADLRASIVDELEDDATLAIWNTACNEKAKELTGKNAGGKKAVSKKPAAK